MKEENKLQKSSKVTHSDMELRSEKVRNLLEEKPPFFLRWGTIIIIIVFMIIMMILCSVPYPHSQGESILQHILWQRC